MLSPKEQRDYYYEQARLRETYNHEIEEAHRRQRIMEQLQELRNMGSQSQPVTEPRARVVSAYDAHLTEEGLVIEVDAKLRVRIPAALMRRVQALLEMAALAKLLPPEDGSAAS